MKDMNLVYVSCLTYNHAPYIKDALDGFCMQQTNFPFVCGIIDDASTDGEPDVIKQYLELNFDLDNPKVVKWEETDDYLRVFAQHKTNKNCFFAVVFLKYNHYQINKSKLTYVSEWRDNAKYIAFCEGDDYWLSPQKLQKQADVLDAHQELDMCACEAVILQDGRNIGKMAPYNDERTILVEDVITGGGSFLSTNTLFYRPSIFSSNVVSSTRHYPLDYFMQIDGALRGGIYYIPICMAAYRRFTLNSWTSKMKGNSRAVYTHKYRVLSTLFLLDCETNKTLTKSIEKVVNSNVFTMFEIGLEGGFFKKQLSTLSYLSKVKLSLKIAKFLLFQRIR